jgi:hypothetical protein
LASITRAFEFVIRFQHRFFEKADIAQNLKNLLSLFVVVNLPCSSERYEKIRIILNRLRKAIQSIAEIDSLEDDVAMMLEGFGELQFSHKKDLKQQII